MPSCIRIIALTIIVLLGMAANSLLARAALGSHLIGALPFTAIRLASGAIMLLVLALLTGTRPKSPHLLMPILLFLYALAFAYGYEQLGAATGTLFLFFSIQATMLAWEVRRGYRLSGMQWVGSGITLAGLWVLVGGISQRPDLFGMVLMLGAGAAWAGYSLLGKKSIDHLAATTANFLYSGLAAIIMLAIYALMKTSHHEAINISFAGLYYTILIGAITSALVYVIWYILMQELSGITSAVIQMLVPVIVVISSAPLLGEHLTPHLLGAGAAMLAGILMVTIANKKEDSRKSEERGRDT